MPELRWILLGLGVLFCLGLWWWETRRRGQASRSLQEFESGEPAFTAAPLHSPPSRVRIEPTFGETPALGQDEWEEPTFDPQPPEPAEPARADRIVSMRLFSAPDAPFGGRALIEALQAEGLEHGKFSIFHKYDAEGATLFSVASLLEPGSFDLDRIGDTDFKGVVFFAVEDQAGEAGLAEMRRTAQALAGRLNGTLTGER